MLEQFAPVVETTLLAERPVREHRWPATAGDHTGAQVILQLGRTGGGATLAPGKPFSIPVFGTGAPR